MTQSDRKPSFGQRTRDISSSFAAGAMMLSHMNRSGLTRYDDLLADLSRLQSEPLRSMSRADRPQRTGPTSRLSWVRWIYR